MRHHPPELPLPRHRLARDDDVGVVALVDAELLPRLGQLIVRPGREVTVVNRLRHALEYRVAQDDLVVAYAIVREARLTDHPNVTQPPLCASRPRCQRRRLGTTPEWPSNEGDPIVSSPDFNVDVATPSAAISECAKGMSRLRDALEAMAEIAEQGGPVEALAPHLRQAWDGVAPVAVVLAVIGTMEWAGPSWPGVPAQ